MPDSATAHAKPVLLAQLPTRLHHHAYAVKDQEVNRHFLEDIIGIPLVATWCERNFNKAVGREVDYCHTFYGIGDGGALAFFQYADEEVWEKSKAIHPEIGNSWHISLKVAQSTFDEIVARLNEAKIQYRTTDHGYCLSLYVTSLDGLPLEFTVDPPNAAEIDKMRRADAHSELARWLTGDRHVNNGDRPH
jgi:catechol 2,3-dioxygenase-like lactoylglutathione lyase family enzyme